MIQPAAKSRGPRWPRVIGNGQTEPVLLPGSVQMHVFLGRGCVKLLRYCDPKVKSCWVRELSSVFLVIKTKLSCLRLWTLIGEVNSKLGLKISVGVFLEQEI